MRVKRDGGGSSVWPRPGANIVLFRPCPASLRRMADLLEFREFPGTILVNSRDFKIAPCNISHSSGINNSPRADVWQPVVVRLNLSCPPGI